MQFAERMNRLGTESAFDVLAKAKQLEAKGRNIIHLEIGQPDFQTPINICEAAFRAMKDGYTGYGPAAGLLELREVVAEHISTTRSIEVHPDAVVVTPGAKPIIFFTLLALVNEGDEVIYPDPGFPIYESVINFVGAKGIPLPLREKLIFNLILMIWLINFERHAC
jgi:aspartate/methionine/tyrosine aminotransferase